MDWSEAARKAAILAQEKGYVTFEELNQLVPPNCRYRAIYVDFERERNLGSGGVDRTIEMSGRAINVPDASRGKWLTLARSREACFRTGPPKLAMAAFDP